MDIRVIFRTLLFCVCSLIVITSCGNDKKDESDPFTDNGKVYAQTMFLPAENANNVIVTFGDLRNAIKEMEGGAEWLTVIKQNYTSGSPAISLTATDNMKDGVSTDARSCTLTVKAINGDQVVLTVTQEGLYTDNGKVYAQTMFLPAENANNVIVTFGDLGNVIKEMEGGAEWLTVTKQSYTSGSPAISLTATDNMKEGVSTDARNCTLTVKAVNGDQVVLTVIQEGHQYEAPKTGIDDSHNTPTDQPAYSRFQ